MDIVTPRQAGIVVRQKRRELEMSQRELAVKARVSERLVIMLEKGDATGIRLDKLLQVLGALGLGMSIGGVGEEAGQPSELQADPSAREEYDDAFRQLIDKRKESVMYAAIHIS